MGVIPKRPQHQLIDVLKDVHNMAARCGGVDYSAADIPTLPFSSTDEQPPLEVIADGDSAPAMIMKAARNLARRVPHGVGADPFSTLVYNAYWIKDQRGPYPQAMSPERVQAMLEFCRKYDLFVETYNAQVDDLRARAQILLWLASLICAMVQKTKASWIDLAGHATNALGTLPADVETVIRHFIPQIESERRLYKVQRDFELWQPWINRRFQHYGLLRLWLTIGETALTVVSLATLATRAFLVSRLVAARGTVRVPTDVARVLGILRTTRTGLKAAQAARAARRAVDYQEVYSAVKAHFEALGWTEKDVIEKALGFANSFDWTKPVTVRVVESGQWFRYTGAGVADKGSFVTHARFFDSKRAIDQLDLGPFMNPATGIQPVEIQGPTVLFEGRIAGAAGGPPRTQAMILDWSNVKFGEAMPIGN